MDIELQRQLFERFPLFFRQPGYRLVDAPPMVDMEIDGPDDEIAGFTVRLPLSYGDGPPYRVSDSSQIDEFGIQCGNGWLKIIERVARGFEDELVKLMVSGTDSNAWPRVAQINEKLGTLHFAVTAKITPYLRELIEAAVDESATICQDCGAEGTLYNRKGWMICLCLGCVEKRELAMSINYDVRRFFSREQEIVRVLRQREPAT